MPFGVRCPLAPFLLCVALLCHGPPARAAEQVAPPQMDCRAAAARAELEHGLPPGLLLAIGQAESGRVDLATGRLEPWPWAINQGGVGRFFASAPAAIDAVARLLAGGVASIDVGCFQVNLQYHPDAFPTLQAAFDPLANAMYAARFLALLHARTGDWRSAVAAYHSADPPRGVPYGNRVFALWTGVPQPAGALPAFAAPDPFAPRLSPLAAAIPVFVPAAFGGRLAASGRRPGLPRVFSPGDAR